MMSQFERVSFKNLIILFFIVLSFVTGLVWTFLMSPDDVVRWIMSSKTNHEKVIEGIDPIDRAIAEKNTTIDDLQSNLQTLKEESKNRIYETVSNSIKNEIILENKNNELFEQIEKQKNTIKICNVRIKKMMKKNEKLSNDNRKLLNKFPIQYNGLLHGKHIAIYYVDSVYKDALKACELLKKMGAKVSLNLGDGGFSKAHVLYYHDGSDLKIADKLYNKMKDEFHLLEIKSSPHLTRYNLFIIFK